MNGPKNARRMVPQLPIGSDPHAVRQRVEALEQLLECSITLPVIRYRVGLDAVVGLVPVVGDLVTAAIGFYLVWEARNLGMPRWKRWRMVANIGIDTALGAIPLAGDVFDIIFRSNSKNLRIIRRHLDRHHPQSRIIEAG